MEIIPVDSYEEAVKDVDIIDHIDQLAQAVSRQMGLGEGMHISAMQRDEFDDEALLSLRTAGAAHSCD